MHENAFYINSCAMYSMKSRKISSTRSRKSFTDVNEETFRVRDAMYLNKAIYLFGKSMWVPFYFPHDDMLELDSLDFTFKNCRLQISK